MRNPSTWTNYAPGSEPALFVAGRGYTGHEHLPWFNLINMNGRVYDPLIAMFLSPDNYVQDPGSTQSYNRYGYCLNNPLKYTDPAGMQSDALYKAGDDGSLRNSIDALCGYFSWMTDVTGAWHFDGGGGGYGGHNYHYGTAGSGIYDTGHPTYITSDVLGSLWYDTPINTVKTYSNVNGQWYNTSTSVINFLYDLGSNMAGWLSGINVASSLSPILASMPDMTRDWLEYHGEMQNEYRSKGTLDWIHYDRYGNRSCTQYSAVSGAGNFKAPTINTGMWTAYQLEISPFTMSSDANSYYGYDGWGFKVRLEDQFNRTNILIHPGMNNGTLGCIGLSDNNQLFDFANRICTYDLSPNHTLNIYVSYEN